VSVSKASTSYPYLKANSVSYTNVDTATVTAQVQVSGTYTASPAVGSYSGPGGAGTFYGGITTGVLFSAGGTFTATTNGTQRWYSNTVPGFAVMDADDTGLSLALRSISGSLNATNNCACVAVNLSARSVANGGSNAAAATSVGGSPGNSTFNTRTYTGGTGGTAGGGAATAPGAGGGGGSIPKSGTNPGGAGSNGQVWIYAYQ
jgi:hypothetical protein